MDARERVPAALVVEVVVSDHAELGDRQRLDELEVALVPVASPRPGEVAEVGEEDRRRIERRDLAHQLREDRLGRRVGPRAAVAGDDEPERVGDRRALDLLRRPGVAVGPVGHFRQRAAGARRARG